MKKYTSLLLTLSLASGLWAGGKGKGKAPATEAKVEGELKGRLIATGGGRVVLLDQTGKALWEHKGKNVHDVWMLKNGNVLFADGNVKEVDPKENKVVFEYAPKVTKGGGAYSCQRLENGNTLVGENATGRVLEVDKDGKIAFEMQVKPYKPGNHHNMRMVRKLKNGNYLVCHSGENVVREHTPKGEVVLELKTDAIAFSAVRLPNGNTMVGHIKKITEFDPKGKRVWEFGAEDAGDVKIRMICGIHVQPNGNVVAGIYSADRSEKGASLFEVTREKKIVWRYYGGRDRAMMGVQLLDADGKILPGDTLR
jgi:prepilin-type processing-associated H-X9-DG protein